MTSDSRASLQKYVLDKQWFQIIQKTVIRAARPLLPTHPGRFILFNPSVLSNGTRFAVDQETQKLFIWFWISGSDLQNIKFRHIFENEFVLGSDHKDLRQNLLPKNRP